MTYPENRTRSNAYDEPDTSAPYGIGFKAQDDAFARAMRKAIQRGRESVEEGVKVTPPGGQRGGVTRAAEKLMVVK